MKFCTHCGTELVDAAVVCTNCGCSVGNKSVVGIVELVLGVAGLVYSMITYSSDTSGFLRYSYTAPYSNHEIMVIAIFIISIVAIIVGVVTLIKANTAKTEDDDVDDMVALDEIVTLVKGNTANTDAEHGRTDYRTWYDSDGIKHESWIDADGNKHET